MYTGGPQVPAGLPCTLLRKTALARAPSHMHPGKILRDRMLAYAWLYPCKIPIPASTVAGGTIEKADVRYFFPKDSKSTLPKVGGMCEQLGRRDEAFGARSWACCRSACCQLECLRLAHSHSVLPCPAQHACSPNLQTFVTLDELDTLRGKNSVGMLLLGFKPLRWALRVGLAREAGLAFSTCAELCCVLHNHTYLCLPWGKVPHLPLSRPLLRRALYTRQLPQGVPPDPQQQLPVPGCVGWSALGSGYAGHAWEQETVLAHLPLLSRLRAAGGRMLPSHLCCCAARCIAAADDKKQPGSATAFIALHEAMQRVCVGGWGWGGGGGLGGEGGWVGGGGGGRAVSCCFTVCLHCSVLG